MDTGMCVLPITDWEKICEQEKCCVGDYVCECVYLQGFSWWQIKQKAPKPMNTNLRNRSGGEGWGPKLL